MDIWQEEYENPKDEVERLYLRRRSGDERDRDRLRWYYSSEANRIVAEIRKFTQDNPLYWRVGWHYYDTILPQRLRMRLWSQGFGRKYEATLVNRRDRRRCREMLRTGHVSLKRKRIGWWAVLRPSRLPYLD